MSVSARRRNRLIVNDREYVWYVKLSDEDNSYVLHVVSNDKRFIVQSKLANPFGLYFITVVGSEFNSLAPSSHWRRFRCPQWERSGAITPACVRQLIEWAAEGNTVLIEVDYHGNVVPFGGLCTSCGRDIHGMLGHDSTDCCYCNSPITERTA